MVLFDEDPVTLIRQTTLNFHTHSDLSSLSRISTSLSTLRSARALRLDSQRARLSGLTRQLRNAEQAHSDALASHDGAGHAREVLRLDTEKFRVAKGVSEMRGEWERREGELRGLNSTLETLERGRSGSAGASSPSLDEDERDVIEEDAEDETVLRLKFYRSLGIEAERDDDSGRFERAVVRGKTGINVIRLGPEVEREVLVRHLWTGI